MGRSEIEGFCKRHPKHRQSPGVCSFCLRERLSLIFSPNPKNTSSLSSSPSSYVSSTYSSPSSSFSPAKVNLEVNNRVLRPRQRGLGGLFRSRSVTFAVENQAESMHSVSGAKKKGGFWSRLIGVTSRRKEIDLHSKTMKETAAAWGYSTRNSHLP